MALRTKMVGTLPTTSHHASMPLSSKPSPSRVHVRPVTILFKKVIVDKNFETVSRLRRYNFRKKVLIKMYYPPELAPDMCDPHNEPHVIYQTNIMWCRGRTQVTPEGRRRVHMGRGYTWYELPPTPRTLEHQVSQMFEQRNPLHYQIENDKFDDDDGACLLCGQPAKYNCFQCKGFYCSTGCQARDWPIHQRVCIPMPKLVHNKQDAENGQQALSSTSETEEKKGESPRLPHGKVFEEPRRTRPRNPLFPQTSTFPTAPSVSALPKPPFKDLPQSAEKPKTTLPKMFPKPSPKMSPKVPSPKSSPLNSVEKTPQNASYKSPKSILNPKSWKAPEPKTPEPKIPEPKQQASFEKPGPGQPQQNGSRKDDPQSPALLTEKETEKKDEHNDSLEFAFEKLFITKEPVEVTIMIDLGNSTYWVQKPSDIEDLTLFMEVLQEEVKAWPDVSPLLGETYVLPCMGLWHRVKVVKMNPLMIEYSDFGGEEEPESKTFKAMSDEFKEIPPFAQMIKFTSNEKLKPDENVEVKLVKNENGLLIVERAPKVTDGVSEIMVDLANEKPVTDLEMVFKYLKINEEGSLQIQTPLRNGVFSVTLVPESIEEEFRARNELLQKVCNENLPNNLGYKPAVGAMVAAMKDDMWVRGKVVKCDDKIEVIACDEGRILRVDKVLPLTETFGTIPALAVTCEFLEMDRTVLTEDLHKFFVNDSNTVDNKPCVDIDCITSNGRKKKCVVKPWIPQPEQKGFTYASISPNSKVIVTAYKDPLKIYLRPIDNSEVDKFTAMALDISAYGSYAQPMSKMPTVGEMVVALYEEDGNFYRALVKDIKNDKIQIKYLDFGNLETTSLKHLYEIPLEYKAYDAAVRPVTLKDVPSDVAMKKEVVQYLDMLVGEERKLTVKFDKIENGVELMINNKESVNGYINGIIAPPCKKPDEVKHRFMLEELPKTTLGKVGDVVELTVLETIIDGVAYFMCVLEEEKLEYIDSTMKEELNKYARSVKGPYIPQINELCIALYNDNYYRAYCYEESDSTTTSTLMFADYGNVAAVPHKDIRPMTKDFLEPSPLGTICMVQNLIPEDMDKIPDRLLTRIRELICNHEQVKAKIVDYSEAELTHAVEIEEITRILKEEKLI